MGSYLQQLALHALALLLLQLQLPLMLLPKADTRGGG